MRGLLKAPAVGRLWLAGISAGIVRWLEMLAYSLWVFAETGSPLAVTLTAFARMLPLLLLGALSGALAERLDRRRLLCGWYILLALAAAGLALLERLHALTVPILAGYALLTGLFWTFETPVRRTMLAEAAGLARVNASMGLEMTSSQVSRLVGPALGGWLMASAGVTGVFLAGVLLYGLGAVLLFELPGAIAGPPAAHRRRITADLRDGVRFVWNQPLLLAVVVSTGLFNLWYMPYISLAPLVAETTMHLGAGPIGLLMSAEGIGAITGSLWVATLAPPPWFALCYSLGAMVSAAGVLLFTWTAAPLAGFAALMFGGFGVACFSTMQTTLMLVGAPADKRVRVMGVLMVAIGMAPLGFLASGGLAELLGARRALASIGAFGVVSMVLCMVAWPSLRRPRSAAAA